jgi:hypothetical protein
VVLDGIPVDVWPIQRSVNVDTGWSPDPDAWRGWYTLEAKSCVIGDFEGENCSTVTTQLRAGVADTTVSYDWPTCQLRPGEELGDRRYDDLGKVYIDQRGKPWLCMRLTREACPPGSRYYINQGEATPGETLSCECSACGIYLNYNKDGWLSVNYYDWPHPIPSQRHHDIENRCKGKFAIRRWSQGSTSRRRRRSETTSTSGSGAIPSARALHTGWAPTGIRRRTSGGCAG